MGSDVHPRPLTPEASNAPSARARLREHADVVLGAILFALFARTFLFQAYEVPSASMEKTVLTGDRIVVNKFVYAPRPSGRLGALLPSRALRRGDVVVFRFPEDPRRDLIKRVVALPGETVEVHDKRVLVDGRPLAEPYVFHADDTVWPDDPDVPELRRRRDQLPPLLVPRDAYFVMGDNRDDSNDSRFWGPVPADSIEGRALLVYWSVAPRSSAPPASGVRRLLSPLDLLLRTRWDRTFQPVR